MPAVGLLTLELHLTESRSLKDKRHYVKGLRDRIRHRFNVSVAETEDHDIWTRSTICVVCVSGSREYAAGLLDQVEADAGNFLGPFLEAATVEWLS
jgi:uncharacterized protein YlxP (DUF503 family)